LKKSEGVTLYTRALKYPVRACVFLLAVGYC